MALDSEYCYVLSTYEKYLSKEVMDQIKEYQ